MSTFRNFYCWPVSFVISVCVSCMVFFQSFFFFFLFFFGVFNFFLACGAPILLCRVNAWLNHAALPDCFQFNADGHTIRWTQTLRNSCWCSSLFAVFLCWFFPSLWRWLFFLPTTTDQKCKSNVQCDLLSWMVKDAFRILFTCVMPPKFRRNFVFCCWFHHFSFATMKWWIVEKLVGKISGSKKGSWDFPWIPLSYRPFQRCILHFKLPIWVDNWMHKLSLKRPHTHKFIEKCAVSTLMSLKSSAADLNRHKSAFWLAKIKVIINLNLIV